MIDRKKLKNLTILEQLRPIPQILAPLSPQMRVTHPYFSFYFLAHSNDLLNISYFTLYTMGLTHRPCLLVSWEERKESGGWGEVRVSIRRQEARR